MAADTIMWKRVAKGHYRSPDTGVEIKYGWDRLVGNWTNEDLGWFIYEPQPGPTLTLWAMGFQLTLHEAKMYDGIDLVESMRMAMADPDFAQRWEPWRAHLKELYG